MTAEEKKALKAKLKNIVANMPEGPGSYQYYDRTGEIIYVGKAKNLKRRVSSYFLKEQNKKTALLVSKIWDIKYINVATEQDALLLENSLISATLQHFVERRQELSVHLYYKRRLPTHIQHSQQVGRRQ